MYIFCLSVLFFNRFVPTSPPGRSDPLNSVYYLPLTLSHPPPLIYGVDRSEEGGIINDDDDDDDDEFCAFENVVQIVVLEYSVRR